MANTTKKLVYSISLVTLVTLISISLIFIIHHHHHHSKFFYSNFSASLPVSRYEGGYTFALTLGTPSQEVSLTIDTGSSLVWVPCSFPLTNYTCFHCDSSNLTFKPNISSSYSFVGCTSPQCKLASEYACYSTYYYCKYIQYYGIGDTTGLLSTETLRLGTHNVPQFMVGCSTSSNQLATGLAGFNNHPASLPKQLGLRKFAYCFSSSGGGTLVLGSSNPEVKSLSYTPFLTSSNPGFQQFYYVLLRSITVGDTRIKIPSSYMFPNNGGQGMLVDSGTTYMIMVSPMVSPIFDLVASQFVKVLGEQYPSERYPSNIGFNLCFLGLTQEKSKIVPKLVFEFDGIGARMELPLENYFQFKDNYACLAINDIPMNKTTLFYAIILGNNAQQNFYLEYDIENRRLGFKPYMCTL